MFLLKKHKKNVDNSLVLSNYCTFIQKLTKA